MISFTKLSQSWVPSSSSSSSSFFCAYISATPPLRRARIAVILSSVLRTLLLLRNSRIPLHQSSNFVRSPSNYPGSGTIFFGTPAWTFSLFATATGAGATDISSVVVCSYSSKASSVICKDPSCSDSASISFVLLELVLVPRSYCYTCLVFRQITLSRFICRFVLLYLSCKVSLSMLYQM